MSNNVFANGNAIACKAGDAKVIASMPDVCLSPPSPPAGPVPVPYPNTSFSKDMQSGSKTVQINGKEVMLKDKSFYKTSPLGDEAATRTFGGSVITHTITGKTYFSAWSMDVKIEGENVDRHLDLTTSNHNPYPGSTAPTPDQEDAVKRLKADQCPCCGKPGGQCPAGLSKDFPTSTNSPKPDRVAWTHNEFYRLDEPAAAGPPAGTKRDPQHRRDFLANNPCAGAPCPNTGKPERKSEAPCDVYRVTTVDEAAELTKNKHVDKPLHRDTSVPKVPQNKGAIEKFFQGNPGGTIMGHDRAAWNAKDVTEQNKVVQIDHVTPRAAGGCPDSPKNTQPHGTKCAKCKAVDTEMANWSNIELEDRRKALGI